MRQHNAIITGVLPRIQGAVDSWCRKRVRMAIQMSGSSFFAATDFASIMIGIPEDQVSVDFLGDLRGLAYHEAGHLRKTLPLPRLIDKVVDATGRPDAGTVQGLSEKALHSAWNVLEDQRMETAMVVDSKNLGRYYNVIVLTHVVQQFSPHTYAWLAAREHVDADVVEAARDMMVDAHGEAETERIEDLVWQYVETSDPVTMWDAVVQLAKFFQATAAPSMQTDEHSFEVQWDADDCAGDQETLEESATPRPSKDETLREKGSKGSKSDQASEAEQDESPDMGDGDEGDENGRETASGAGNKPGQSFGKRAKDALERAKDARNQDKNLTNDMRSFNDALHDTRNQTPLPRVPTSFINIDGGDMAEAIRVNRSLRLLMESARAEHAPSWQGGQRTGVLDVIRYRTRQPGDMEFFRNEAPGGDMHLPNLSVSVILDGSGSMSHHVTKLGVAAYAIKTACDACEVPCTVTVYDTRAHLLWDAEDRPVTIPDSFCPLGGTDPTEALEVVDAQLHDKARHLVIVMTDGHWSGWRDKSLANYQFPNRDLVVLFWNTHPTSINGLEGVTSARVDNLMEIPQIVRRYLIQSM